MTIDAIRELHEARPFRPFDIIMGDGAKLHVPHPEFLAHPNRGRTLVLFDRSGTFNVIDLLMVTRLQVAGNGRSHWRRKAG
jgi:hypothetical protein